MRKYIPMFWLFKFVLCVRVSLLEFKMDSRPAGM